MTATNPDQFPILVEFMEKNQGIAKQFLNSLQYRDTIKNLWNEVKDRLNSVGPPERSVEGWKKVWRDFKYHTKNKIRENKKSVSGTGGGPCRIKRLSNLEERVDVLLNLREQINGINANNFGCGGQLSQSSTNNPEIEMITPASSSNSNIEVIVEENEESSTIQPIIVNDSTETTRAKRATKPPKETSKSLLKKQMQLQDIFYKKQQLFLEKQEAQRTEIIKTLKDIRRVKEKKFSFEKQKWKAQQLISLNEFKQKAQSLELKERELDLKQQELDMRRYSY